MVNFELKTKFNFYFNKLIFLATVEPNRFSASVSSLNSLPKVTDYSSINNDDAPPTYASLKFNALNSGS